MHATYQYPKFEYAAAEEQRTGRAPRRPVVIVGGGPVGLTAALDLGLQGVPVVVIDEDDTVSVGSRAVCYAKRALEVWDRLGLAAPLVDKGVRWKIGKVFHRNDLVYQFDLLPEPGHKFPAFINLQQYHLEAALVERARSVETVELRWRHKFVAIEARADHVVLTVEAPDGAYRMDCDWLIAADGARSAVRRALGLEFKGQVFNDRFLIADVVMKAGFPPERRFWFDPPFHPRQSALLHMQPDDVWRLDFQLGPDADPDEEKRPERVIPRVRAMLGAGVEFELEWVSVYTFQCRRLDSFRHGRVLFAGDSAHQVSPFGARGANSGVQDAENLAWKLARVMSGRAPERLLDSYCAEREQAADENIRHSTRATDFISPKGPVSRAFRDAVLDLATDCDFARRLINSGRLSTATIHAGSPLNTPDEAADRFACALCPGSPAADAPIRRGGAPGWLLEELGGDFTLLCFGTAPPGLDDVETAPLRVLVVGPEIEDAEGLAARRYDARSGTAYLLRPDQHVAARWRWPEAGKIDAALRRALGRED